MDYPFRSKESVFSKECQFNLRVRQETAMEFCPVIKGVLFQWWDETPPFQKIQIL